MSVSSQYQKKLRARLAVCAAAYEICNDSLITDQEYDRLSLLVDVDIQTDNVRLDMFFKEHYEPHTGTWVYEHPDIDRLVHIAEGIINRSNDCVSAPQTDNRDKISGSRTS